MKIENIIRDLGYGWRQLRRNPILALTAILTLAIGIGANTAVFNIASALLLRDPVGVADPARLIDIGVRVRGRGFGSGSYPNYLDIRQRATSLDGVYAYSRFPASLSVGDEMAFGAHVTTNYFTTLGAVPAAGRVLLPDDNSDVVVLSYSFWTRRFNRDSAVVGQTLQLNGRPFTVAGVAAEGFQGTGIRAADLWIPLQGTTNRAAGAVVMGARLKPGATMAQAAAELDTIGRALQQEYPLENRDTALVAAALSPMPGETAPVAAFLALLMGIVTVVLAIACANVSGVLLARAASRRREIAVRVAIGAGRSRVVGQLLTETVLLFAISAVTGLALERGMTSMLVSQLPSLPFPLAVPLAFGGRVVVFALAITLFAALLAGLSPALQASRSDLVSGFKDDGSGAAGRGRLRHAFVLAQLTLSILLVVVAGLFIRALQEVQSSGSGFDLRGVELVSIDLPASGYPAASRPLLMREIVERVRRLPEVEEATIAAVMPGGFEGIGLGGVSVPGVEPPRGEPFFSAVWNITAPGYFRTVHMPIVTGRDFGESDRVGTQPVIILGEGAERRFWPGEEAVGRSVELRSWTPDSPAKKLLVLGIARDPKFGSLVDGTTGIYAYLPMQQQYEAWMPAIIAARATRGRRLTAEIREAVAATAPDLPIARTQTAEEYAALGLLPQRIAASVAGSLGIVGLLLVGIGIYGVTAYTVARRTREIGIRLALGANRSNILGMVLKQGMSLFAIGSAAGLSLAAAASPVLGLFLLGMPSLDPVIFAASAALFAVLCFIASCIPAVRAMRIDAVRALRND